MYIVHGEHIGVVTITWYTNKAQRPPFPPFICCFDTRGAAAGARAGCKRHVNNTEPQAQADNMYLGDLLLLGLLVLLLSLCFLDSSGPLSIPDLAGLIPLGGDGSKISTDDTTLVLHGLPRALFGNLLCDTLLVQSSVWDGP